MRYIGIIVLLVLCLALLLFTGCMIDTVKPELASGNLENQEDINPNSNNYQNPSTDPVEEPVTEEPGTVYPQKWATGTGTVGDPWANDCIKTAFTNTPAGETIYLRAGYYQLAGSLSINKAINIIGEGRNKTIIVTADAYGFNISADYVTLKGFTMDGAAQASGDKPIIGMANCDYHVLEDIETKNGITAGIQNFQSNYSSYKNIYSHDNGTAGFHPCTDTAGKNIHNTYRDIFCWDNGNSGFGDRGKQTTPVTASYNTYDNLQCWDNGVNGIAIVYQSNIELSNSSSTGNMGSGLYLTYIEDSTIDNCLFTLNGVGNEQNGILLSAGVKNVNFTNVIVKNNDTGINIFNAKNIVFTSCQSYDDRATPLQKYGMQLAGTNSGISILNCKLSPNKKGDIYNPAGVVLTVIAEKKRLPKC